MQSRAKHQHKPHASWEELETDMGRTAKPKQIKIAQGTFRSDRDSNIQITATAKPPNAPTWLTTEAKAEWRRLARPLHDAGLLTAVDRGTFSLYCVAWGEWVEATRLVAREGSTIKTTNGNSIQHPAVSIANKAWGRVIKAGLHFGLTPSARSTMRIGGSESLTPEDLRARGIIGL